MPDYTPTPQAAIDPATTFTELAQMLTRAQTLAERSERADVAETIGQALADATRKQELAVVICAETSRGKSSLANVLVGYPDLLPVDVDVATGVYVLISYAEEPRAKVVTEDVPDGIEVGVDGLREWVSVGSNPGNGKRVTRVEVGVPSPLLGEGITLADTPGVGGLDSAHGEMTLSALALADALLFVLDASAPISAPELEFLKRAAAQVQTVVFAFTKTDLFPGSDEVLEENRRLIAKHAPRFAKHRFFPIQSPAAARAIGKRQAGDDAAADRLAKRSGVPALENHLRRVVVGRADRIRVANAYRIAVSACNQLLKDLRNRERSVAGDPEPRQRLEERRAELTELEGRTDNWQARASQSFERLTRRLQNELHHRVSTFRFEFDSDIDRNWRHERFEQVTDELELGIRRIRLELELELVRGVVRVTSELISELGVNNVVVGEAKLEVPDRELGGLDPVEVSGLSGARQVVLSVVGGVATLAGLVIPGASSIAGVLGAGAGISGRSMLSSKFKLDHERGSAERSRAKERARFVLDAFQRDCQYAMSEVIGAARSETLESVRKEIRTQLATTKRQLATVSEESKKSADKGPELAELHAIRAEVEALRGECQRALHALLAVAKAEDRAAPPKSPSPSDAAPPSSRPPTPPPDAS